MSFVTKIWSALSGWKTVLAYLAAHLFGDYPLVMASFEALIQNPKDPNKIVEFIIQLALAVGVADRVRKNLKEVR